MEEALQSLLGVGVTNLKKSYGGGCINKGSVYKTMDGKKMFVKFNSKEGADLMFKGEFEGLKAIGDTETVRVPVPIVTGSTKNSQHFLAMEFLNDLSQVFNTDSEASRTLGSNLADLHLHNLKSGKPINKFGFHINTSCGFILQDNTWTDDWITFITERRLQQQIDLLSKTKSECPLKKKIVDDYWPRLKLKIPKLFDGIKVMPSLLHGDLWSGNAALATPKPAIFDPAAFYGHSEYDLAITTMFGPFPKGFYKAYYEKIPKPEGYDAREKLYQLFHYLNHWNHFGSSYNTVTENTFETLLDAVG
ncbi:fructosamine-3-kinase-like isoform X2 [Adelges cooleyi]|uniref:fructosamine-3-kinase-like isoform X2 n=1 Tax=Adelges cooleyi TaxID=133065 RepID=UPI00217FC45F|nr:fructosamine-3-kinase-like isoform X2 [Adelges cooleyi]